MGETEPEVREEDVTGPTTIPDEERDPVQEGAPLEDEPDAAEVEPAEPDGEEQTTDEPEPAERTDKEMEAVFRQLDRLRKDTAKRVGNIFGDDATQLMDCPLCATVAPGYLWPPDVAPLADEQVTALRLLLNMPVATDYPQTDDFQACPRCNGLGKVRTGSKVQNYEVTECIRCASKGYVATAVQLPHANGSAHEQDADLTTGPTRYGHELPAVDPDTEAILQSLKDRGYMIVEPLQPPRPVAP